MWWTDSVGPDNLWTQHAARVGAYKVINTYTDWIYLNLFKLISVNAFLMMTDNSGFLFVFFLSYGKRSWSLLWNSALGNIVGNSSERLRASCRRMESYIREGSPADNTQNHFILKYTEAEGSTIFCRLSGILVNMVSRRDTNLNVNLFREHYFTFILYIMMIVRCKFILTFIFIGFLLWTT